MERRGFLDRTLLLTRRLQVRGAPREPAARLLPQEEIWRPLTWAHFRYVVLRHLRVEGAHTLDDLACEPPEVLGLSLSRQELIAVLESCRRRSLVARLDPSSNAGPLAAEDEWIVTADGRRASRPAISWFFAHAGRVSTAGLTLITSVVGILGIRLSLGHDAEASVLALAFVIASAFLIVMWIVVLLRHRSSGERGRRIVASDWSRWGREVPGLRVKAFRKFPWKWFSLGLVAAAGAIAALLVLPALGAHVLPLLLVFAPAYLLMIPVFLWTSRWDEIESWGRDQRRAIVLGEALRDLSKSEDGR